MDRNDILNFWLAVGHYVWMLRLANERADMQAVLYWKRLVDAAKRQVTAAHRALAPEAFMCW